MSFLSNLLGKGLAQEMLKAYAKVLITLLKQRGAMWARDNVVGKFVHVATVGSRVYAIAFTDTEQPPEDHPNAWHLQEVDLVDLEVHLWGVSFPKKKFAQLPPEKVLRVRW